MGWAAPVVAEAIDWPRPVYAYAVVGPEDGVRLIVPIQRVIGVADRRRAVSSGLDYIPARASTAERASAAPSD
jgi:hypothetical protein